MVEIYVLDGGPGNGKTSVIKELKKRGYKCIDEAPRLLSENDSRFKGKSIKEVSKEQFYPAVIDLMIQQAKEAVKNNDVCFIDRGLGGALAYFKLANYKVEDKKLEFIKNFRYTKVFVFDFLDKYKKDSLRQETEEEQKEIQKNIIECYESLGIVPIIVPFMSVEKRADFVLKNIHSKL
jgi:predicted ATPase